MSETVIRGSAAPQVRAGGHPSHGICLADSRLCVRQRVEGLARPRRRQLRGTS